MNARSTLNSDRGFVVFFLVKGPSESVGLSDVFSGSACGIRGILRCFRSYTKRVNILFVPSTQKRNLNELVTIE